MHGCKYLIENLDEVIRIAELKENLDYGNHKSASKHEDHLSAAMEKDIKRRWGLILPVSTAMEIPGLKLFSMGVNERFGIDDTREYLPKKRLMTYLGKERLLKNQKICVWIKYNLNPLCLETFC